MVEYDGDGNIVVTGTVSNDTIYVNASNPANILIQINGITITGPWSLDPGINRIIIDTLSGNNNVQLSGGVNGEIYGGSGNDTILGGSGNDVVWCGSGKSNINCGGGNNVIVGGEGMDQLQCTSGFNVMIAGGLIPGSLNGNDWDYAALRALGDAWATSGGGQAGANAASAAIGTSLSTAPGLYVADGAMDVVFCGSGKDWIIVRSNDILSGYNPGAGDWKTLIV